MIGEPGTGGHAGSCEDKESPQMSLFEEESDDRPGPVSALENAIQIIRENAPRGGQRLAA